MRTKCGATYSRSGAREPGNEASCHNRKLLFGTMQTEYIVAQEVTTADTWPLIQDSSGRVLDEYSLRKVAFSKVYRHEYWWVYMYVVRSLVDLNLFNGCSRFILILKSFSVHTRLISHA